MAGSGTPQLENTSNILQHQTLNLIFQEEYIPRFFQLLQRGFMVKARRGCSLKSLLCQQPGISPEYLEERIQTIFIDGKAVDNIERAIPADGATIAISAAMPGLVGATLRRGGFYAALRSQITYTAGEECASEGEAMFKLKLFNLLIDELGRGFLEKGIWIDGKVLQDFFKGQAESFWEGCEEIELDGSKVKPQKLLETHWCGEEKQVLFKVASTRSGI